MNSISLHDYAALVGSPFLRASIRREGFGRGEGCYESFMDQLYADIDGHIYHMQSNRELRKGDSEDRLSADIIAGLKVQGYAATADTKTGGHVDISVTLGGYSWIGEAKKDGNFKEGFLQLTTRYVPASGNYAHNQGGLIFYMVESDNAEGRLNDWRSALTQNGHVCSDCKNNVLAFYSDHTLEGSGTSFKVRTMAVALHHGPKDKSARTSEARRAAKEPLASAAEKRVAKAQVGPTESKRPGRLASAKAKLQGR